MDSDCINRPSKCTWSLNPTEKSPHSDRSAQSNRKVELPNILHAIGQTPLVHLKNISKKYGVKCEILAKCEFMNPGGSVKDRIADRMIEDAEAKGILKPGYTIIEPTSGNTGIGLAMAAAVKGYKCIIVMPEKMSNEKALVLKALGAQIVRTPTHASFDSPEGHIATSQRLSEEIPNSVILNQYTNPGNPLAHYDRTGNEIWEQCGGKIDYAIIGAGTGGTVTGIGRKLKELNPNIKIIGVDPIGSILARTAAGHDDIPTAFYEVEGIGYDFIPTTLDLNIVDEWMEIGDKDSFNAARDLIKYEGLLCGGSSGANFFAALQIAKTLPENKRIVVIMPDSIRNYLTKFVSDEWMQSRGFSDIPEPLECNKQWWDLPVSTCEFEKPILLQSGTTIAESLLVLNNGHYTQLPVLNNLGKIEGIIETNKIYNVLMSGTTEQTESIEKLLNKSYQVINPTESLSKLYTMLQTNNYVVIVDTNKNETFCGIATLSLLYNFINGRYVNVK